MAISMTACDLCSMYKPWNIQLQVVNVIMEEFWLQVCYIISKLDIVKENLIKALAVVGRILQMHWKLLGEFV